MRYISFSDYFDKYCEDFEEEFLEEVEENGSSDICFVLTCHPQVIGRPARMKMLERLVKHMLETNEVEFLTGIEAATRFKNNHPK